MREFRFGGESLDRSRSKGQVAVWVHVLLCLTLGMACALAGCYDAADGTRETALSVTPIEVARGQATVVTMSVPEGALVRSDALVNIAPVDGIAMGPLGSSDNKDVAVLMTVDSAATLGQRTVTVESSGLRATGYVQVVAGSEVSPTVTCAPSAVAQGTNTTVAITGMNTHFVQGQSVLTILPSDGVTLSGFGVQSATSAGCDVSVTPDAPVGTRDVWITTGEEVAIGSLVIDQGSETTPSIVIDPGDIQAGTLVKFSVEGKNTHFSGESSVAVGTGAGIAVSDVTATSETHLTFIGTAEVSASPGARVVTVTSPAGDSDEVVTAKVMITAGPSMVADPSAGLQGALDMAVRFFGTNTAFDASTEIEAAPGSGVHVKDLSVVNAYIMDVVVDIAEDAAPGEIAFTTTHHTPPVSATFEVLENEVDTESDTGEDPDGGQDAGPSCDDFEVLPDTISAGRYKVSIHLRGQGSGWTSNTEVALDGELDHVVVHSASVGTAQDIHLTLTAGLLASAETVEILVTQGTETLCGELTILGESIHEAAIPAGHLPTYNTYQGEVDARIGDLYEFYHLTPQAGDALVLHAIPEDRVTLDPVLRIIDSTGDESLIYVNDETSLGVDARLAYYFAEAGDYYVGVGAWGQNEYGKYDFHIYRLTHGGIVPEGAEDNDTLAAPEVIDAPMPVVVHGELSDPADVDVFQVTTTGPAAIDVVARRLGKWEGSTADTQVTVYALDQTEITSNATWYEVPTTQDPRVFLDQAGTYLVEVAGEDQTTGFYAFNVRSRVVINELDNNKLTIDPYVELVGPPNFDLSSHEICTYGPTGTPVDPANPCLSLVDKATNSSGYYVAYDSILEVDTLNLPLEQPGAVVLLENGSVVDKVQYGSVGSDTFAEGVPAELGERRTIGRGGGVDTNNNRVDFIYMGSSTLGMPNDRAYQSPVPPYGEPEG
ncbi:MAG: hypothetical protein QNJ97_20450 [Myxococcota bacterium]|nr:hypothetical protein [Myxococcota bacterium]